MIVILKDTDLAARVETIGEVRRIEQFSPEAAQALALAETVVYRPVNQPAVELVLKDKEPLPPKGWRRIRHERF